MRTHLALTTVLSFGLLTLLSACGSSDTATAPSTVSATKAALIGTLDGSLADNAVYEFDFVSDLDGTSLPLVIGKTIWNDALAAKVKKAYDAGRPVTLISATPDDINTLRRIVGLSGVYELPAMFSYADSYSVDLDNAGNTHELIMLPNLASATETSYSVAEGNISTLTGTKDVIDMFLESELDQQRRAAVVGTWVAQDATRDANASAAKSAAKAAVAGKIEDYNLADIARSTEITHTFSQGGNSYQIINNVWSFYDPDKKESYFYVQQRGIFAAANEFTKDLGIEKSKFASRYSVSNFVPGYLGNNADVMIVANAPKTFEGKVSMSDGIDYSFSGKVNASLKASEKPEAGVFGELAAGVTIKHSLSYDIADVTLRNLSGTKLNETTWSFGLRWPDWDGSCFHVEDYYSPVPEVGRSTYQPSTEWIWRVKDKVKQTFPEGFQIQTAFYAELASRFMLPILAPVKCFSIDKTFGTSGLYGTMSVPWPPTTATIPAKK